MFELMPPWNPKVLLFAIFCAAAFIRTTLVTSSDSMFYAKLSI